MNYETVIGLEIHAQLKTQSKMFCACSTAFGSPPNTNICPVCTAQPGSLPTPNRLAVEMAMKVALAIGGTIQAQSVFARKNYFYPDLTKGYQISQYEFPLSRGGSITIATDAGGSRTVSITRLQLEEDAGKLVHDQGDPHESLVDFNRCGVPLIEIISGPDLRTPSEATSYLRAMRAILIALDVCEGNMQEGNFRCDMNVSLRPVGATTLGTRTEVKNLNSFRAVERAIDSEIERQQRLLQNGAVIAQETRLWNEARNTTEAMRSKEEAHDYRYFPDPDLLPVVIEQEWIEKVRASLPELPAAKMARFVTDYGLPAYDAQVLTAEKALAEYYEACVAAYHQPKKLSNWITTELLGLLKAEDRDIRSSRVQPAELARLVQLIDAGTISGKMAKEVFAEMVRSGSDATATIDRLGLQQISNTSELERIVDEILAARPDHVAQYRAGKIGLFAFFVGQIMKATKGQANPQLVNELLKKKLGG